MHQPRGIAEEEIIGQCKTGSLKYQELLYKQFYGYAMGIGLRYSISRDDALEVVNDAFIKIFNNIKNYFIQPVRCHALNGPNQSKVPCFC